MPTPHKDNAAQVLVESEADPHADQAQAEGNAEEIGDTDCHNPLEGDADYDGINYISRRPQSSAGEDVANSADLEDDVDPEDDRAHADNLGILSQESEDIWPDQCEECAASQGRDHRKAK